MKKLVSIKVNWLKEKLVYCGLAVISFLFLAIPRYVFAEEAWEKAGIEKKHLDWIGDIMRSPYLYLSVIAILVVLAIIFILRKSKIS